MKPTKNLTIVTAYTCTQCKKLHLEKADAMKCCTCKSCGHKFDGCEPVLRIVKCGHCIYPEHVRYYRNLVDKAVSDLREAEKKLNKFLKLKRMPKGSADRYNP